MLSLFISISAASAINWVLCLHPLDKLDNASSRHMAVRACVCSPHAHFLFILRFSHLLHHHRCSTCSQPCLLLCNNRCLYHGKRHHQELRRFVGLPHLASFHRSFDRSLTAFVGLLASSSGRTDRQCRSLEDPPRHQTNHRTRGGRIRILPRVTLFALTSHRVDLLEPVLLCFGWRLALVFLWPLLAISSFHSTQG